MLSYCKVRGNSLYSLLTVFFFPHAMAVPAEIKSEGKSCVVRGEGDGMPGQKKHKKGQPVDEEQVT